MVALVQAAHQHKRSLRAYRCPCVAGALGVAVDMSGKTKGMDKNQFWVTIWKIIATAISVIVLTISGCIAHDTYRIAELIIHGADPTKASCAVSSFTNPAICGAVAK